MAVNGAFPAWAAVAGPSGGFSSGPGATAIATNNPLGGQPGFPPPAASPASLSDNLETGQATLLGAYGGFMRRVS